MPNHTYTAHALHSGQPVTATVSGPPLGRYCSMARADQLAAAALAALPTGAVLYGVVHTATNRPVWVNQHYGNPAPAHPLFATERQPTPKGTRPYQTLSTYVG